MKRLSFSPSTAAAGAASPGLRVPAAATRPTAAAMDRNRRQLEILQQEIAAPTAQRGEIAPVDAQMITALANMGRSFFAGRQQKKVDEQSDRLLAEELAIQRGQDPFADALQPIVPPSLRGIGPIKPDNYEDLSAPHGLVKPGNIDNLYDRKSLQNPDGSISTTDSASFGTDRGEVLVPQVIDGQRFEGSAAFDQYRKTGQNLGTFDTPSNADLYAQELHNEQARRMGLDGPAEVSPSSSYRAAADAQRAGVSSYEGALQATRGNEQSARADHDVAALSDPRAAPFAWQRLAPKKQAEPFTLVRGGKRFDASGKEVANNPAAGADENPFGRVNPSDFTPESLRKFAATRDPGDLVPINRTFGRYNPRDYTAESWAQFVASGDPGVLEQMRPSQLTDTAGGGKATFDPLHPEKLTPVVTDAAGSAAAAAKAGAVTTATKTAENTVAAQAALPDGLADIDFMRKNIKGLVEAPGFDTIYGLSGVVNPSNYVAGTDAANAQAKRNQLSAEAFGVSIQKMKGLGALSNAEGSRVTDAFTRATNPKISADEARLGWDEVNSYLELAENRLRQKAAGNFSGAPATPPGASAADRVGATASLRPPEVGEVQDGYRFVGGDPSKPESWQRQ